MKNILDYLQSHAGDILSDVEKLTRIESPSHYKDGINRVQDVMQGWLDSMGKVKRRTNEIGDMLHAQIQGQSSERVILLAHMDTVYPIGAWKEIWSIK